MEGLGEQPKPNATPEYVEKFGPLEECPDPNHGPSQNPTATHSMSQAPSATPTRTTLSTSTLPATTEPTPSIKEEPGSEPEPEICRAKSKDRKTTTEQVKQCPSKRQKIRAQFQEELDNLNKRINSGLGPASKDVTQWSEFEKKIVEGFLRYIDELEKNDAPEERSMASKVRLRPARRREVVAEVG